MDRSRYEELLPWAAVDGAQVVLVGVGGLNSYVGSAVARLGVGRVAAVDPDGVEEGNLGTQDYDTRHVGMPKVEALAERMREINPEIVVEAAQQRVPGWRPGGEYAMMVTGPDNMDARRASWDLWKETGQGSVYVDHRMGATSYEVYVVTSARGTVGREYERMLAEDTGYAKDLCGARAIAYTGMMAGSRVGAIVAGCLKAQLEGSVIPEGEEAWSLDWVTGAGAERIHRPRWRV